MLKVAPLILLAITIAAGPLPAQVRGFSTDALSEVARREALLKSVPNVDTLRTQMRILSEEPHEAGSERSRHVAELILARFQAMGLDAHIEQFGP